MIVADATDVRMRIPEGTESHQWAPATQEMNAFATKDVFLQ